MLVDGLKNQYKKDFINILKSGSVQPIVDVSQKRFTEHLQ